MSATDLPARVVEPWLRRSAAELLAAAHASDDPSEDGHATLQALVNEELIPDILQSLHCHAGNHAEALRGLRDHPDYERALDELPDVCAKPREVLALLLSQLLFERIEEDEAGRGIPWEEVLGLD